MSRLALKFIILSVVFNSGTCVAQSFKNIMIDIQGKSGYPPCEPSIVINPKNPKKILAGAILNKVYTSKDGGETWHIDKLTSELGVFGDPCVIANRKGHYYYFHLSDPAGKGWSDPSLLDRIVAQKSKNGKKWTDGTGVGLNGAKDQDKEWAVCDPITDEVYVTWTQFDKYKSFAWGDSSVILFAKADKNLKAFSEPIRISEKAGACLDDDETTEGAVPTVGPNGEIYVAWALGDKIYFDRSLDSGNTWLAKDLHAADIIGGWDQDIQGIERCNGMPVLQCDRSGGEHNGRIYINYTDQRNGLRNSDVWLVYSDDKGSTWSRPVKVNQDQSKRHQFFTWLTVDQSSGYVYMVYYDRRNTTGHYTDVYLSVSKDGGQSFSDHKISESSFLPEKDVFFGDYNNISAVEGNVRPIWTRYEDGKLSVWTAIINQADLD